ncbi:glycosyltransferase family 4 protein [Kineococcus sp. NPDC059986]|uniref:glycosyltransferase family 4 protein n=1 Tax=Kineococcus sp. NPDC059986 TaxID=3155538 RepID=UPI00344FBD00
MRLLVITDGVPPEHRGGVASSVLVEVDELARRGHEVTVLVRRHDRTAPLVEDRGHYRLLRHPAPARGSRGYYAHPAVTLARVPGWLRSLVAREGFDALYVHSTFHAAAAVRAGLGDRTVFRFHAPASLEVGLDAAGGKYPLVRAAGGLAGRVVADLTRRAELAAVDGTARTLTTSWYVRRLLQQVHPAASARVDVVPLAVDLDRFSPGPAERDRLGLSGDPLVVTVRRLVRRMGLENLLDAFGAVVERHPGARLVVGGTGYLAAELRARADRLGLPVDFPGFVAEEDLPALYRSADLFVLPTLEMEGFGIVTLEAFASGLPVVATPVGANPEVAGSLDARTVAASTSPADLAAAVLRGLDLRTELAARARAHVQERFSPAAVGDRVEAALAEVAAARTAQQAGASAASR